MVKGVAFTTPTRLGSPQSLALYYLFSCITSFCHLTEQSRYTLICECVIVQSLEDFSYCLTLISQHLSDASLYTLIFYLTLSRLARLGTLTAQKLYFMVEELIPFYDTLLIKDAFDCCEFFSFSLVILINSFLCLFCLPYIFIITWGFLFVKGFFTTFLKVSWS